MIQEVESKIKSDVERDRKMYQKLKQNEKQINENKEPEYTYPRKKKEEPNMKIVVTSDYKIEYDKSLKPQTIREKSIERKVPADQAKSFIKKQPSVAEDRVDFNREPLTKLSNENIVYNSDNEDLM